MKRSFFPDSSLTIDVYVFQKLTTQNPVIPQNK